MSGTIAVNKLKEHPKNKHYFTDITGEKRNEVKNSIEVNGMRDPIKCTTAYTVVSGHQRLSIAKELGLTEVPVEIIDVDEWKAEYLLIAENVERRGQAESDPIKKGRIANFLKEYWGVKNGGDSSSRHNDENKTARDIAEVVGVQASNLGRTLKLNDLIPELQTLVSAKELGATAAGQLAYLTEAEQRAIYDTTAKKAEPITLTDAKDYRAEAKRAQEEKQSLADRLRKSEEEARKRQAEKEAEVRRLETDLEMEKGKQKEVVEKEVIKEVIKEVVPQETARKLKEIEKSRRKLEETLIETRERNRHLEKVDRSVKSDLANPLYDMYRSVSGTNGYLKVFREGNSFSREVIAGSDEKIRDKVLSELALAKNHIQDVERMFEGERTEIIDQK